MSVYHKLTMNNQAQVVTQQLKDNTWCATYSGFVEYGSTETIALERLSKELRFASDVLMRIAIKPSISDKARLP